MTNHDQFYRASTKLRPVPIKVGKKILSRPWPLELYPLLACSGLKVGSRVADLGAMAAVKGPVVPRSVGAL